MSPPGIVLLFSPRSKKHMAVKQVHENWTFDMDCDCSASPSGAALPLAMPCLWVYFLGVWEKRTFSQNVKQLF